LKKPSEEGFFFDKDEKSKDLCGDLLYGFDLYSIVKHSLCQILINSE
jgi:hypothetical protein